MTVLIETPIASEETSAKALTPPITGPARWTAAALLTVGGLLQVAEFALEPATGSSADRVAWWAAHPSQIGLSQAVGILAIPFLIGGFLTMARLTRQHSRRLTAVAVTLLTGGMVGLAIVHGVEMVANWLVQSGNTQAALGVLDITQPGVPGVVSFVLFLVGAMGGSLVMLVAQVRSRYVPRLAPVFLLAFMVLDFAVGSGLVGHVVGLASGVVLAWSVVTGYVRTPRGTRAPRGSRRSSPERAH
jgi:hypothetical protein